MSDEAFEGGCLCGAIRYRFSGAPKITSICHCVSCRRAAGAPAVAWVTVWRSGFSVMKGSPAVFHSSPPVTRTFCGTCGTPLTYEHEEGPETIDITTASLDQPELFPPAKEIWLDHRIAWMPVNPAASHYAGSGLGPEVG